MEGLGYLHAIWDWLTIPTLAGIGVVLQWGLVIAILPRIILKRREAGTNIAWLMVITALPFVGAAQH